MPRSITMFHVGISTLFFTILIALLFCLHLMHPFYISSDMDLLTFIDMLSINTGKVPVHLIHPGTGMFFILYWMERIFDLFSLSPIVSFADLKYSLEPMLVMANKIYLYRYINLVILILIPGLLMYALTNIRKEFLFLLTGIILFFSGQGLWCYNLNLIRTEVFSIFFYSLALVFLSYSLSQKKINFFYYSITLICIGFSFISKIQVVSLAAIVLIFLIYFYPRKTFPDWMFSLKFHYCIIFFFLYFFLVSLFTKTDHLGIKLDSVQFFFNLSLGLPLFLIFVLRLFFQVLKSKESVSKNWDIHLMAHHASMTFIAICLCIIIVSSITLNFKEFLYYTTAQFKIIFLNIENESVIKHFTKNIKPLKSLKGYWPYLFLGFLLGVNNIYNLIRYKNFKLSCLYILVSLLLLFNITITTRIIIKDQIWNELFIASFIMGSFHLTLKYTLSKKKKLIISFFLLIGSIFIFHRNVFSTPYRYPYLYDFDNFLKATRLIELIKPHDRVKFVQYLKQPYPNIEKKYYLKRKLLRPFQYSLSLKSIFPNDNFTIIDISIPYKNSFLLRNINGKKSKRTNCPSIICNESSYVISSKKWQNVIQIFQQKDTKIYAVRDKKISDYKCNRFFKKSGKNFYYKIEPHCQLYKIDTYHRAFIILENS